MEIKKTILPFFLFVIININSQSQWESVSKSPFEAFRFYNGTNGMTAILDENSNKLVSYHSSAHSGLIVRLKTDLDNITSIESNEIDWIDLDSPMRGGGFDISLKDTGSYNLYGIGSRKDSCYNYQGVTVFEQRLDPTSNANNYQIIRKQITLTETDNRQNNGVADNHGRYFFCNNGRNKKLYMIDMNTSSDIPVDLSSTYSLPEDYIIKFKKITDTVQTNGSTNTHIIGLITTPHDSNNNLNHIIYIRIKNDGLTNPYTIARYKISSNVDSDSDGKIDGIVDNSLNMSILPHAFDLGLNNLGQAELLFFSRPNQNIYSVNLTANIGFTKNEKGNIVYNNSPNSVDLSRIRGLGYLENGSCLLFAYTNAAINGNPTNNNYHYYFDGINSLTENCFDDNNSGKRVGGKIVDKIYTLNNTHNTKSFITRDIVGSGISTEEKRIRLYTIGDVSPVCNGTNLNVYEPELNDLLIGTTFTKGGGHRIRSMAISDNHLLYDGMEFLNYRNLDDLQDPIDPLNPDITDNEYLNLSTEAIEPIGADEFVVGLYLGAYLQRIEINNNEIIVKDFHKIDDDFNKISSLAFDGDNVYIGLYYNNSSTTNTSKIYVYNVNNDTNIDDITNSIIEIQETNHVKSLKVIDYNNGNTIEKWLYGIAENNSNNVHKIFRRNISNINSSTTEVFTLPNTVSDPIKDLEIISTVARTKNLYFVTQKTSSGKLFSINVSSPNTTMTANDLIELRDFDKAPMNITTFLDKHLIISFRCGEVGYLTQDENNWILGFDDIPLPSDFNEDVILANKEDKHLYTATREGVGSTFDNNEGGLIFKYELPEYLGFAYEFCYLSNSDPKEVLSGDFNNDDYDDLIQLTEATDNSGQLVWNVKTNSLNNDFNDDGSYIWGPANADFVYTGDFNGDGYDDIGINNYSNPASVANGEWIIRLNDTFGSFAQQYRFKWLDLPNQPDKIVIGDYNGDGFSDLAIFKENDGWYIKENNGIPNQISFSSTTKHIIWSNSPDFVFSGDFNGDGFDDLGIKSTSTIGQWVVRFNDGMTNFNFGNQKRYVWEPNPDFVTVGDYNKDGLADLCSFDNNISPKKTKFRLNYGYYKSHANSSTSNKNANTVTKNLKHNTTNKKKTVSLYPNPIKEVLNLSYATIFDVEVFDNYGRLVFQSSNQSNYSIDFKNFMPGIYFVKTRTNNFGKIFKVINE